MSTEILQDNFYPVHGHVREGARIRMKNGDVATLRRRREGWQMFVEGVPHATPTPSAHVLSCLVHVYPSEEI